MRRFLGLLLLLAPASAHAAEATLCNDGFDTGDNAAFQGGFALGEAAGVKVDAPADGYPFTIERVHLFFGGADDGDGFNVTLRVFDDDGTSLFDDPGFPGALLGEQLNADLLSSTDGVNEIVLDTPVTVNDGAVWIGIFFGHNGAPSIAADTDGTVDGDRNAIFTAGSWADSPSFGLPGDWIIRAVVDTPTATPVARCTFDEVGVGEGEGEGEEGEGEEGEGEEGEGEEGEGEEGEGEEGEGEEGEGEGGELVVSSVNPSTAVEGVEARVTITGEGFDDDTTFRVGSAECGDVDVQNDGAALCTVPPTLVVGVYDVVAQAGAVTFVFPSGFTVTAEGCSCGLASTSATWVALGALALLRRRRRAP